jgi:aspartyl-tRNA(Asn)/glutamyl-tRNA(Gln) amidotransferase subunit C
MQITDEKINQLAHLSRLTFDNNEKAKIKQDLERILELCESLNKIDTEGVDPLIHMTNSENIVREDNPHQEFSREELLKNAPKKDSDYFRVPKVIEQAK